MIGETIDAVDFDADTEPPSADLAFLVVRRAGATEVVDVLEGQDVTFGRVPGARVVIDDPRISREHARVRRSGVELWVSDLGSRNGTKVNGDLVTNAERRLSAGDVIRLGDVEIVVAGAWASRPSARAAGVEGLELPDGVIVADPGMLNVYRLTKRAARTDTSVLVHGETGAGKEIVAGQIHRFSPRAKGPFVSLNCASLPLTLLESELFGHERGAFTGADKRKIGYIEAASGGTLFLDEIGELPAETQAKLLRVLEARRLSRVGGTAEVAVDVRVVSATHRDLKAEIAAGRFREDLYFRLCAFTIQLPPLRERPVEITLLADLFARECAARMSAPAPVISPEAARALSSYRWPGNVRELKNAIEHALVVTETDRIELGDLPESVRGGGGGAGPGASPSGPMRARVDDTERRTIEEALAAEGGNQTRSAKRLGISRRGLIYKLHKHGLLKR